MAVDSVKELAKHIADSLSSVDARTESEKDGWLITTPQQTILIRVISPEEITITLKERGYGELEPNRG